MSNLNNIFIANMTTPQKGIFEVLVVHVIAQKWNEKIIRTKKILAKEVTEYLKVKF